MITYQSNTILLLDIVPEFGRVSYGVFSRSKVLLEEIQFLYQEAAKNCTNKLDSLRRLHDKILHYSKGVCTSYLFNYVTFCCAAEDGYLEVIRMLRDGSLGKVYPLHSYIPAAAIRGNQIEVLRALRDGSLGELCKWNNYAVICAIHQGNLEILRMLRDGSLGGICPWDALAAEVAAREGYVVFLRALRDGSLGGRCPWDKVVCREVGSGHKEIIDLIDSGELD